MGLYSPFCTPIHSTVFNSFLPCLVDMLFKAMFSVVAFKAEFSQNSFVSIHGKVTSSILLSAKDPVEIYRFAPRHVREKCWTMYVFPERGRFQVKKILQSLRVYSSVPNYYSMVISPIPIIFVSRLC